jgi:ligand-binding SRPBCC domain-containing protein
MDYHHRFILKAPLEEVLAFHLSARSLLAITPPFLFMRDVDAPQCMTEDSRMAFTLWLGPLPVRWQARIESLDSSGFDDVQIEGPFAAWKHTHRFEAQQDGTCLVHDHVRLRLEYHPIWPRTTVSASTAERTPPPTEPWPGPRQ